MVNVELDMPMEDIRNLYLAVCDALKYWPGGDPKQQEAYQQLKIFLFSIICESAYES